MPGKDLPARTPGTTTLRSSIEGNERDRLSEIAELAGRGDVDSAARLAESLADPRWRVRRAAADALADCLAPGPALHAVLEAMRTGYRDLGLLNGVLWVLDRTKLDVTAALQEFLSDPDPDLRIYASQSLGERGDPAAVPALLRTLEDPDLNVRCQAIEALGKLRSAAATDALIVIAEAREFASAWTAIDALAAIGDARIGSRLYPLLQDDLLAEAAVGALGQLGDEEAVAAIITVLGTRRAPVPVVARALAAICERYQQRYGKGSYIAGLVSALLTPAVLQEVLAACKDCQPGDAPHLAKMLAWLDGADVIEALARLLASPEAREEAGQALVRRGLAASSVVAALLQSGDPELARQGIELLGRMGDASQAPALVSVLLEDENLVPVAAGALAMIGDIRAYPALSTLLGHPRAIVRQAAVAAINSVAHPDRAKDLQLWLRDPSPLVRESALKIACYLGCFSDLEVILACTNDEHEQVRKAAVESIALLDDERIPDLLASALRTGTSGVRAAAVRALALASPGKSSPLLVDALGDADVWVRYYAAKALGAESALDQPALNALENLARNDEAMQVRVAAVEALTRFSNPALLPLFAALAHSPDADLARAALWALGAMRHRDALPELIAALDSGESVARRAAIEALGASKQPAAVEPLGRAVHDEDHDLAAAAIEALGHIDCIQAVKALIEWMQFARWRDTCIEVLIRNGCGRVDWIAGGLEHSNLDVRRGVIEVLTRMHDRNAVWALRIGATDSTAAVRYAAMTALAHMGMAG